MRRYRRKRRIFPKNNRVFVLICILLLVTSFFAGLANLRLRPITFSLAQSYGSRAVLDIINNSVDKYFNDEKIGYSDLVRLSYNSSGFVTSIEYDSLELNRMKTGCLELLNKNLSKIRYLKVKVPIGSLFNDLSLSGRGPAITVRISESAVPKIDILSTFEAVGVNQSRHEIRIRVSAEVDVYLPPKNAQFTVTQDYVLAQTVIVGDVPTDHLILES